MYLNLEVITLISSVILFPLFGAVLILASHKINSIQKFIPIAISIMSFSSIVFLAYWHKGTIHGTNDVSYQIIEANYSDVLMLAEKLRINFVIEPIGIVFSLISSFLWVINSIYAKSYFNSCKNYKQSSFFAFLSLSMFATYGLAFSASLITSFVFYELLTIFTLPLVGYQINPSKINNVKIYFSQLMIASVGFLLPAIIIFESLKPGLFFSTYGSIYTNFSHLDKKTSLAIAIALILMTHGCAKAAIFPLNSWLSSAMVAPTPVSAFLHAVAVVKSGVIFLIKTNVYFIGHKTVINAQIPKLLIHQNYLILMTSLTMVVYSLKALKAQAIKSILAFSTISQLSYIIGASAISSKVSLQYAMLQLVSHSLAKITLFFAAGAIYIKTQKTELKQIVGIGFQMPITMLFFCISAFSIFGIPPTFGAISKNCIIKQSAISGNLFFMFSILISSSFSVVYLLKIPYLAFKNPLIKSFSNPIKINEAPITMLICMFITTALTVTLYFNHNFLMKILA